MSRKRKRVPVVVTVTSSNGPQLHPETTGNRKILGTIAVAETAYAMARWWLVPVSMLWIPLCSRT